VRQRLSQSSIELGPATKSRIAEKGFFMFRVNEDQTGALELTDFPPPSQTEVESEWGDAWVRIWDLTSIATEKLLAEATDEKKRLALIELLIEDQAKERLMRHDPVEKVKAEWGSG
jgi:hypothetical protein